MWAVDKIFSKFNKTIIFLRTKYFKSIFGYLGHGSVICGKIKVYNPEKIILGNFCTVNEGCLLNARDKIVIEDFVHISPYVIINTGFLDVSRKKKSRKHLTSPVIIKEGAWVASGAIINPGVIIGENSVVAAGAVVTKDVPSNVMVAGIPAKVLKKI